MTGIVMDIQKFCLQDGPGIRTTVFLKGCNMSCKWCHNPESMEVLPTLMYFEEKCVTCEACKEVCESKVHSFENRMHTVDRSKCIHCGKCIEICRSSALEISGKEYTADEIIDEISKDEKYYFSSGGGITFSGGEASMQFDFLLELMKKCKEKSYSLALDTNGLMTKEKLMILSKYVDIFLVDYKVTGEERHIQWTGVTNKITLDSLQTMEELGAEVHLRCPMIKGVNDQEEHFEAIKNLKLKYTCIKNVEIMAYHDTGKDKWKQCGKLYELQHIKTVSKKQKEEWEIKIKML